jgi:hypothetical protein
VCPGKGWEVYRSSRMFAAACVNEINDTLKQSSVRLDHLKHVK